jgi:hypothetical protein
VDEVHEALKESQTMKSFLSTAETTTKRLRIPPPIAIAHRLIAYWIIHKFKLFPSQESNNPSSNNPSSSL